MVAQRKTAQPAVCNGNVGELFALIEGVRRDTATSWRRIERGAPIALMGALR